MADPAKVAAERETQRQIFIRVCRDSGFALSAERACVLSGRITDDPPLLIWAAFPSMEVMEAIAAGTHPAVRHELEGGDNG